MPTDPALVRRGWSRSATPTSPARPAAGPANSNASESYVDALGPTAYYDNATNTGEQINRCHRSKAAEIFIGGGVNSLDLACSGARTSTFTDSSGNFKPGLDFYNSSGRQGQALMLQSFAATHNVKMVVVSIGGNDFNFASIVQSCVTDFLTSPSWWKNYCHDDSSVTSNFTAANVAAVRARIATAYQNLRTAMRNAGYADEVVDAAGAELRVADPQRLGVPLLRVRLHPSEHRRLRLLERRRQLGQQHRAPHHQRRRRRRGHRLRA